ncbi:MAG: hypothetical protein AB1749_01690 [Pseudomonadota bacterium]
MATGGSDQGTARLTPAEAAPLVGRERLAVRLVGMGLMIFAALIAWRLAFGEIGGLGLVALALAALLVAAAAVMPSLTRCPRCGASLGRQSLAMLPDHCASCGVEIPRPDLLDGEIDN